MYMYTRPTFRLAFKLAARNRTPKYLDAQIHRRMVEAMDKLCLEAIRRVSRASLSRGTIRALNRIGRV